MSTNWKTGVQTTVLTHVGTALGNKRKPTVEPQANMEDSLAGRERCRQKRCILCNFTFRIKF